MARDTAAAIGSTGTVASAVLRLASELVSKDPRTQAIQTIFIASNPHPDGLRHLLVQGPGAGKYSEIHARYHPTLQRYQSAFGFYDIFLIGARERRVLCTVAKEIDLGVSLREPPYDKTSLARLTERAMALQEPEMHVVEDYEPYLPSRSAPAAFLGAPVWRGGAKIGVLAIQISVDELNRVMTGGGNWEEEGLGKTGQAYILGPDNKLRSDLRSSVPPEVAASIRSGERGTHLGRDLNNVPVLRSHTPLAIPGLNWTLIAEIKADEALQPVAGLRMKVLLWGAGIALAVFAAASLLARSVTKPVLALARNAPALDEATSKPVCPYSRTTSSGSSRLHSIRWRRTCNVQPSRRKSSKYSPAG